MSGNESQLHLKDLLRGGWWGVGQRGEPRGAGLDVHSVRFDGEEGNGHLLSIYNVPGAMSGPFPIYPPNILHIVK